MCIRDRVKTDPDTGQRWYIFQVDGETRRFQSSELLIHFFETYDGKIGRGVLSLAREAIAGDAAAQRFGRKFYANGARAMRKNKLHSTRQSRCMRQLRNQSSGNWVRGRRFYSASRADAPRLLLAAANDLADQIANTLR